MLVEGVKNMVKSSGFSSSDDDIAIIAGDIKRNKDGIGVSYKIHANLIHSNLKETKLKISSTAVNEIEKYLGKVIQDTINRSMDNEVVILYTEAFINAKSKYVIKLGKPEKVIEL